MFNLILITLFVGCSEDSDISVEQADISSLFAANQEELLLRVFVDPESSMADELITAGSTNEVVISVHDFAYEPELALREGVTSNGYAVLSRVPSAALPIPPSSIIPLTDDLFNRLEREFEYFSTPQRSAFFISGDNGLLFDSPSPTQRNQRLATFLRELGVAVYFDFLPNTLDSDEVSSSASDTLFILTGKPSSFSPEITGTIEQHLIVGGPLLLAIEPDDDNGAFEQITEILEVQFGDGVLVSDVGQVREDIGESSPQDRKNHATGAFLAHESNPNLSNRSSSASQLLFSTASWIQPTNSPTPLFTPTVLSNDAAFGDLNSNAILDGDETAGALVLAGVSVGRAGRPFRAGILADSTMLSDRWLLHPTNGIFTKDLVQWLLPEEPSVTEPTTDIIAEEQVSTHTLTPLFTDDQIQSIQLRDSIKSVSTFVRRDEYGLFTTVSSESARGAENFRGNEALDGFGASGFSLDYLRRWEEQPEEKLEEFGLGSDIRTLNVQLTSGQAFTFSLGARNSTLNATYALEHSSNNVFLLSYEDYSPLAQPIRSLRDSRFLEDEDWRLIQIGIEDETFRIESRGESWVIGGRPADNTLVTNWATEIFRLRAMPNDFVVDSAEAHLTIYVTAESGVVSTVEIGRAVSEEGEVIPVGRTSHTRAWVGLPPRTADIVLSATTLLSQATQR